MPAFLQPIIAALCLLGLSLCAQAQTLRIVSESWAPYIYEEQDTLKGRDYEAAQIVLQRLGVEVEWQLLPWKRCLMAIELGQADAILDIFRTPEREVSMIYPDEPMSQIEFVLFYANARPYPFRQLPDLRGLKVGVSAGYWYANRQFRDSTLFTREAAPSHSANLGKLLRDRVDLVINDRRGGTFLIKQMGIQADISHHPQVISRDQLYLGLRRSAGLETLAQRFSNELRRFKREPAYATLSARYEPRAMTHATGSATAR
ncbi:transporter substrate-binding domain-containing protein [uncultured Pseudomonas sp.]|uniref:substrate-binding periplasmic protein n=1 Tax=uncultured Pseudomonas sp. TaxID=114707 RepID=UPI0026049053|nr:transporter substrate-binding domain-containing protein [uncultured Pseudomonas sp.]